MSEYSDFPKDFLKRTLSNIESYTGNYEVTNLINNCLGLIVIPKQLLIDKLPQYHFDLIDLTYKINRQNIIHEINNDFTLINTLRHIRNGLSHGRIEQASDRGIIIGLRIYDKFSERDNDNFSLELTINQLKEFTIELSKEFLKE